MRRHVQRMRHIGGNFAVIAGDRQRLLGKTRGVISMDDVMVGSRVLRDLGQQVLRNLPCVGADCVALVAKPGSCHQCQRVKCCRFKILRIILVDALPTGFEAC